MMRVRIHAAALHSLPCLNGMHRYYDIGLVINYVTVHKNYFLKILHCCPVGSTNGRKLKHVKVG
jgi:hypothetical protein